MLYTNGKKAYIVDSDGIHGANVTAKDKVVEVRELESVSVTPAGSVKELPAGCTPVTLDELVARFNISEGNPLTYGTAKKGK